MARNEGLGRHSSGDQIETINLCSMNYKRRYRAMVYAQ